MGDGSLSTVPDGYHSVNPWVIPKGAAEFISFVQDVFGARERAEARTPDDDGLLIHAEVEIGDSVIGVFDSKADWPPTPSFLQVYVEEAAAVLERAKGAGAEVVTELSDFVYGEKLARFRDPWGNLWWINQRVEEVDWEAEEKRLQEPAAVEGLNYVKDTLFHEMRTRFGGDPEHKSGD